MSTDPSLLDLLVFHGALTLAKVTLIAAGALALSRLLKRGPASARHALWTGTLVVLLGLPTLALLPGTAPSIVVPGLPLPAQPGESHLYRSLDLPIRTGPLDEGGGSGGGEDDRVSEAGFRAISGPEADRAAGSGVALGGAPPGPTVATPAPTGPSPTPETVRPVHIDRWSVLLWGWLVGTFALLLPLMIALARGHRIIRSSRALHSPGWLVAIESARERVGFRRRVDVRLAPGAATAMAGGVLRPVVLLPDGAAQWSPQLRDIVLLHELVHLRRRDPARQLLGRVVLALYWFHPLVWCVVRRAAIDREKACDERVIELGERPSAYARHLLEFPVPAPRSLAGLAAFHHPDLETRLMAILNPTPRSLRRWSAIMIAAVGLLWIGTVAALGPARVAAPESTQEVAPSPAVPGPIIESAEPVAATTAPAESLAATVAHPEAVALTSEAFLAQSRCPDSRDLIAGARRTENREGQSWMMRQALGDLSLCFGGSGEIEWSEDRARILSMSVGSVVELVVSGEGGTQRLDIVEERDGPRIRWAVNGEERAVTPQVLEWRDALLAYFGAHFERAFTRGQEARLRGEIARIRGGEARLRGEESRIRGEAARIRGEEARVWGEEARLRGEIARLRGEEARTQGGIARVRGEEARLRSALSNVSTEIRSLERARDRVTSPDARAGLDVAIAELAGESERIAGEIDGLEVSARVAEFEALLAEHRVGMRERIPEIEEEIDALRTDGRVAEVRQELAAHRLATEGRIEEIQAELARSREGSARRIREVEAEIEALNTSGTLEAIGQRIEELERRVLDAIRRVGFEGGVR